MPRIERLIFALRPKVGLKAYAGLVWAAIRRHPLAWSAFALVAAPASSSATSTGCASPSPRACPGTWCWWRRPRRRRAACKRGDLVAWRWPGGLIYPEGAVFLKVVKGLPGDQVSTFGRDFYVNGEYVGRAKAVSRLGQALVANQPGMVPAGHYYLYAPHRDSLDSRYAATGYVAHERILGRAYGLF
jgi:type IV secretory pathway protease TraF